MDTADRKRVRELAYTMEATFRGDPGGLNNAQQNAHHAIEMLRESFVNESDDTLCCIARALAYSVGILAQTPAGMVGQRMEAMIACYPLAAGTLAGVYVLPEHECDKKEPKEKAPAPAPKRTDDHLKGTGQYL